MAGRLEDLLQIRYAGKDRRDLLEMEIRLMGEQPRHRGLARARRPPENQGAQGFRRDEAGEDSIRADQMVLADDLGEVLRPHPVGQRTRCVLVEAGG